MSQRLAAVQQMSLDLGPVTNRVPDVSDERKEQLAKAGEKKMPWTKENDQYYEGVSVTSH